MSFIKDTEEWVVENFPMCEFVDAERQLEFGQYYIYLTLNIPELAFRKLNTLSKGKTRVLSTSFEILTNKKVVFKQTCLNNMWNLLNELTSDISNTQ